MVLFLQLQIMSEVSPGRGGARGTHCVRPFHSVLASYCCVTHFPIMIYVAILTHTFIISLLLVDREPRVWLSRAFQLRDTSSLTSSFQTLTGKDTLLGSVWGCGCFLRSSWTRGFGTSMAIFLPGLLPHVGLSEELFTTRSQTEQARQIQSSL